jgi:hypothetical protein
MRPKHVAPSIWRPTRDVAKGRRSLFRACNGMAAQHRFAPSAARRIPALPGRPSKPQESAPQSGHLRARRVSLDAEAFGDRIEPIRAKTGQDWHSAGWRRAPSLTKADLLKKRHFLAKRANSGLLFRKRIDRRRGGDCLILRSVKGASRRALQRPARAPRALERPSRPLRGASGRGGARSLE